MNPEIRKAGNIRVTMALDLRQIQRSQAKSSPAAATWFRAWHALFKLPEMKRQRRFIIQPKIAGLRGYLGKKASPMNVPMQG